jgi:hypothetical protein
VSQALPIINHYASLPPITIMPVFHSRTRKTPLKYASKLHRYQPIIMHHTMPLNSPELFIPTDARRKSADDNSKPEHNLITQNPDNFSVWLPVPSTEISVKMIQHLVDCNATG